MSKPIQCSIKCVVKKNKSGSWDVIWNGKWMASFKYDWDAHDFVNKKTFGAWSILEGINNVA